MSANRQRPCAPAHRNTCFLLAFHRCFPYPTAEKAMEGSSLQGPLRVLVTSPAGPPFTGQTPKCKTLPTSLVCQYLFLRADARGTRWRVPASSARFVFRSLPYPAPRHFQVPECVMVSAFNVPQCPFSHRGPDGRGNDGDFPLSEAASGSGLTSSQTPAPYRFQNA